MLPAPTRAQITGLLLAGGRGARMGGADKGLLPLDAEPLALHVLRRLQPQVARVLISANRSIEAYAAWAPVVTDPAPDRFDGPLAGIEAALRSVEVQWLAVVPCDLPRLPLDLVAQLAAGLAGAPAAYAVPRGERHSLACLLHASLAPQLAQLRAAGERRVHAWFKSIDARPVPFADPAPFANLNAPHELDAAQRR